MVRGLATLYFHLAHVPSAFESKQGPTVWEQVTGQGSTAQCAKVKHTTLAFAKGKGFIVRLTSKETGSKVQICPPEAQRE